MNIAEALTLVLELAQQNIIDFDHEDDELNAQRKKQTEACEVVEDFIDRLGYIPDTSSESVDKIPFDDGENF